MKERTVLGAVALFMLAASLPLVLSGPALLPAAATRETAVVVLAGKRVVLDAGHGGPDGGAVGRGGTSEKSMTLDIARRLESLLAQAGAEVVLTRTDERDLAKSGTRSLRQRKREDLEARAKIVAAAHADAFLSLHANSFPSIAAEHGAQTFYLAGANPGNKRLAEAIQEELRRITQNTERNANDKIDQYLLEQAKIPACTVEVGFLSNPREEHLLNTPDYRQQLAWAIFVGLVHFFQEGLRPATSVGRQK
ncbi:MAG: N-acetylmuramoyl-L-alanine amidase [Symbiobacteriia bacterium]